jgi:hypothetical protein
MIGDAFLAVAALALLAAIIEITSAIRGNRSAGRWMLCVLFLILGCSCFFLSTSVQIHLDQAYPNLGRLLSNASTLVAAFVILSLLLMLSSPPEQARPKIQHRLLVLMAALAGMSLLFAVTPLPPIIGDFGKLYRLHPALLGYIAIYIAFLGTALTELLFLSWRYALLARHKRSLRLGLQFMAAGSVAGLLYLAEKAVYVATQWLGIPPPLGADQSCTSLITPAQCAFSITFPTAAVFMISLGATLPVWAPALATPVRRIDQARTYRRLGPLWTALHDAIPEIALTEPTKSHPHPQRDLGYRLYRRVIEILDGCLTLRPYRDPQTAETARAEAQRRGLSGTSLRATVEAAQIAAALEIRTAGPRISATPRSSGESRSGDEKPIDLASEAAWLGAVSAAFATSPIVQDQTRQIRNAVL